MPNFIFNITRTFKFVIDYQQVILFNTSVYFLLRNYAASGGE
jgi:hypothetical protein